MSVPHLAARLVPAHQRHWLGDSCRLQSDKCLIVPVSRLTSEATKINHFWDTLQQRPLIDEVMFTIED
jgi:hypothetical protein